MENREDICSVCGMLESRDPLVFEKNIEGRGVNLCGRDAVEYQVGWRPENSPIRPNVLRFVYLRNPGFFLKQDSFIDLIRKARTYMSKGNYDKATEEYRAAESFDDLPDPYKREIKISLEISDRAKALTEKIDSTRGELREAEERYQKEEASERYSIAGLELTIRQSKRKLQELPEFWERKMRELHRI